MQYGYLGSIRTKPGYRDAVAAILMRGSDGLRAAGCEVYIVGVSPTEADLIWVSEVWRSKQHHDASLQTDEVKAAIAEAMPLLTGEFTSQELAVIGGLGLS